MRRLVLSGQQALRSHCQFGLNAEKGSFRGLFVLIGSRPVHGEAQSGQR